MSFLYPQFLLGLFALAVPIIVHLFNFRRAKKIYFSNTAFLRNVKESSSSKLRLKHLLILLCRILFILFLVLTFAQPVILSDQREEPNHSVLIYLDNSFSMSNEVATEMKGLDQGINIINEIAQNYPETTRFQLLTNEFNALSSQWKTKQELLEASTEISLSGTARSITEVLDRQKRALTTSANETSDVYMVSDWQKSTVGELENFRPDTLQKYFLVPVESEHNANVYIDTLYLTNPTLNRNESNSLTAILKNTSGKDVTDLILKLYANNVQVANASIDIAANSENSISIALNFPLQPQNACRISFEEFPVTFDNDFYFTLNVAGKIQILEIKREDEPTPIERVYANQSLFDFKTFNINNLDYNLISNADLIILNEVENLSPTLLSTLSDFLNKEGHVIVIPSENPDLSSLGQITKLAVSPVTQQEMNALAIPDLNDPFFKNIFEKTNESFDMPQAKNNIEWGGSGHIILKYNNNKSYFSEFIRTGHVFILGSPLKDNFTSFHKHAIFVPVMYRIAFQSKSVTEKLYYSLNESSAVLKLDSISRNNIYKLVQDNQELIPNQRSYGNELYLELPQHSLEVGFYQLVVNNKGEKILSFNYDKAESNLEQYKKEDLEKVFTNRKNIRIFEAENTELFGRQIKEGRVGVPLWKYALILSLIFLLAEVLLIRFFR